MNAARALGALQELGSVVWTLLAAWTALPGGHQATAPWLAALAGGALAIGVLGSIRHVLAVRGPDDRAGRRARHAPLSF